MGEKQFINSGDVKIDKQEFHSSKSAIPISDVNIDKTVISAEFPFAKNASK